MNPKNGDKLSQLGFGCMRLPRKGAGIDYERSTALVRKAIDSGVNYIDTAYIYPGSEEFLGEALKDGYRDKIKLATKLPLVFIKNGEFDKYFNKELERLKTDRIDYYLLHMLTSFNQYESFVNMGVLEWAEDNKRKGRIVNLGFSFHGAYSEFIKIIDAREWDFCMIQYNYIDENHQAGKRGLQYAYKKGLPVMIMEPLRGGKLANEVPKKAREAFEAVKRGRSMPEWGLRWVWNHPEVTLLLSGMSNESQVAENLALANIATVDSLSQQELSAYKKATEIIRGAVKVPCTGCGYCLDCPKGINIPAVFDHYNEIGSVAAGKVLMAKMRYIMEMYVLRSGEPRYASVCIKCGKCEKHCPQGINIRQQLEKAAVALESPFTRVLGKIAKAFVGGKNK
ncbi:MAG: aldo/keto reductase [Clostridiales bacterium]|nr:aldo/keto reductase [Clostridiales bacterium]